MKPGCFTQIYIHLVFTVKSREALLTKDIRKQIFEYMSGILKKRGVKPIIINGVEDHVHILVGVNPSLSVSEIVHDLKRSTSLLINADGLTQKKFFWQPGYGGFSVSRSQLDRVCRYIENQENHHRKSTFREELIALLEKHHIEYDPRYLFEFFPADWDVLRTNRLKTPTR